ncbi:MAG: DUF1428 domain-containing protein [Paracoccaceae bacterium]
MTYVMSYIATVPTAKKAAYVKISTTMAAVFKEHGATRVVECWGVDVPPGNLTSFPMAVKAETGETVVTGWQEWPDKPTQEAGMQKAMQDPRMAIMQDVPIDGKRMIFAGFDVIADV